MNSRAIFASAILAICVCASASAQVQFAGPGKISGPVTIAPALSPFLPVDLLLTGNGTSIGTTVTNGNLNTATTGQLGACWFNSGTGMKFAAPQAGPPINLIASGTTSTPATATQAVSYDNTVNGSTFNCSFPSGTTAVEVIGVLQPNYAGATSHQDIMQMTGGGGASGAGGWLQLANHHVGCGSSYGLDLESNATGNSVGSCAALTAGTTYYFDWMINGDQASGCGMSLNVYTTALVQVGSTIHDGGGLACSVAVGGINFGNSATSTSSATLNYFQVLAININNFNAADWPNIVNGYKKSIWVSDYNITAGTGSGTTVTGNTHNNVAIGDCEIVTLYWAGSGTASMSSPAGQTGTWTASPNGKETGVSYNVESFIKPVTSAGADVLKATITSSAQLDLSAIVARGTACTFDQHPVLKTGTSTAVTSNTTGTTSTANEIAVGAYVPIGFPTVAVGAPWVVSEFSPAGLAYQVLSATGTVTYTATQTSNSNFASTVYTIQ